MSFEIKNARNNSRSVGKLFNNDNFHRILSPPKAIDELILRFSMVFKFMRQAHLPLQMDYTNFSA